MKRRKLIADTDNDFRRAYFRWGRPQKRIIKLAWANLFHPGGPGDDAFGNRLRGITPPPAGELTWIETFNPIAHDPVNA